MFRKCPLLALLLLQVLLVTSQRQCHADQCRLGSATVGPDQTEFFQRMVALNTVISRHSGTQDAYSVVDTDINAVNAAFLRKNKCDAEPTITSAFQQLDKKTHGSIRSSDLQMTIHNNIDGQNYWLVLFTIKGGRAEMTTISNSSKPGLVQRRAKEYQQLLNVILSEVKTHDMKLLISLSDTGYTGPGKEYVLSNDGNPGSDLLFLPRSLFHHGLGSLKQIAALPNCTYSTGKAVFRGSTTGSAWVYNASRPLPLRDSTGAVGLRYKVANLSRYRPDLLDAGFTKVIDEDHLPPDRGHRLSFEMALKQEGLMKGRLTDYQQKCSSAVVVVDGHAQADRLPRQMTYGNPVIIIHEHKKRIPSWQKAASPNAERWQDEFWYGEPRHGLEWLWIGIDELEKTLETLLSDPARMAMLGRNARAFVQERLSERRLKCYMYALLTEYGKRYRA